MQVERYRIILTGWVMTGYQTRDVVSELSRLFKIPEDRVRPLLVGEPSIIRRDLTLEKAERLRNKLEQRGAVCSIKRLVRHEADLKKRQPDQAEIMEPDLNMDSTQFIMTEEFQDTQGIRPITPGSKAIKEKWWRFSKPVVALLMGLLIVAVLWGYFYLYPERYSSNLTPNVFTFPPAKGSDTGGK